MTRPNGPDIPEELKVISHSDARVQYTSVRFAHTLDLEGFRASIGSIGHPYDNAVAETQFGLFKTEALRKDSPFRAEPLPSITDVETVIMEWVHWHNHHRIHSTTNNTTPTKAEQEYYLSRVRLCGRGS